MSLPINHGEVCGYLGLNASGNTTTPVPHISLFMNARFCFPRSTAAHHRKECAHQPRTLPFICPYSRLVGNWPLPGTRTTQNTFLLVALFMNALFAIQFGVTHIVEICRVFYRVILPHPRR